ncbi:MAG: chemotaxis protein CheW [Lachnospiraceae bacterium]|nr:chemotaxis protein CheW [Lachnospiraceae bacterium]
MEKTANNDISTNQFIIVRIGNEQYGINIKIVDNIVRMQQITRVPKAQKYFVGVINLRGEIVPVMSLRRRFGIEDDEFTNATRIIIIKPEQQATVGFIVDSVKEVVTLEEDQIERNSISTDAEGQSYISAVGKYKDELISILNIQTVINDKEQA